MEENKARYIGSSTAVNVVKDTQKSNFGGFWLRFAALFIDGFIIAFICMPVLFILGINPLAILIAPGIREVEITSLVVSSIYTVYLIATRGATLGKQLCKLKVVRVDGFSLGYPHAAIRWFAPLMVLFFLSYLQASTLWFLASAICLVAHPQRRTLHDFLAGTAVIKLNPSKNTAKNASGEGQVTLPPQ